MALFVYLLISTLSAEIKTHNAQENNDSAPMHSTYGAI